MNIEQATLKLEHGKKARDKHLMYEFLEQYEFLEGSPTLQYEKYTECIGKFTLDRLNSSSE